MDDGCGETNPENTYTNGKTGIYIASAQDSFCITGMGLVYLEHGVVIYDADALNIHDNFIAECGNCVELRGSGQASKVTDNLMGAGYKGYSIYAQNFGGLLVAVNNIFPRGASSVYFTGVTRSIITGNRFHAFYPGMVVLENNSCENMVSSNHLLRMRESWPPMQMHSNGLDDLYGIVYISGNDNSVVANHFSEIIDTQYITPPEAKPVIIHIVKGKRNYISNNHIVSATENAEEPDMAAASCFYTQVSALMINENAEPLAVTTVKVENESVQNTVLDSGSEIQVVMDRMVNAFRATPTIEI